MAARKKASTTEKTIIKPGNTDIQRLKAITHKMLDRLEQALTSPPAKKEEDTEEKTYEWIFGNKTSLATTLVTLAELLFRLDEGDRMNDANPTGVTATASTRAISTSDAVLIDDLVRRARAYSAPAATPPVTGDSFS